MATVNEPPLIVIVGPTASGKTALAIELARRWGGEIIAADSRTIYKGLAIGTAQPDKDQQAAATHHLLNIVAPDQRYSVAEFQTAAKQIITEIRARGKLPVMVGGSGLYVDSVIFDYDFSHPDSNPHTTATYASLPIETLHEMLKKQRIPLPENRDNRRYIERALQRGAAPPDNRGSVIGNMLVVGVSTDKNDLQARIHERAAAMFQSRVVDEGQHAAMMYGWDAPGLSGNIYRVVRALTQGELNEPQAIERFSRLDWQLARRQLTWFKRNPAIVWRPREEVVTYIESRLGRMNGQVVLR